MKSESRHVADVESILGPEIEPVLKRQIAARFVSSFGDQTEDGFVMEELGLALRPEAEALLPFLKGLAKLAVQVVLKPGDLAGLAARLIDIVGEAAALIRSANVGPRKAAILAALKLYGPGGATARNLEQWMLDDITLLEEELISLSRREPPLVELRTPDVWVALA